MFTKIAQYYDALYHLKDYGAAARQLHELLQQWNPEAKSLLDVACGTGKHIEFLKQFYQVEGVDINSELLEGARRRFPDVRFYEADMINFQLGRRYDVVTCLFSSIGYVRLVENLAKAVASMAHHLASNGILIIEPWFTPQTYWVGKITANFLDDPELKIAWMYTSEVKERISIFDIHYLVGTPKGVQHFTERHEMGLFTHEEYLAAFQKIGLTAHYDPKGLFGRGMYMSKRS